MLKVSSSAGISRALWKVLGFCRSSSVGLFNERDDYRMWFFFPIIVLLPSLLQVGRAATNGKRDGCEKWGVTAGGVCV